MIEKIVKDYLTVTLGNVPVYLERQKTMPAKYVMIERTGSRRDNLITTSTFAVQSYDSSMFKAAMLNEDVKEAMDGLTVNKEVSSCKLNSDYNFTDTTTKEYRYQAVYDICHY